MPGGVIEVGRSMRPGWLRRLDPFPLLGALRIAARRRRAGRRAGASSMDAPAEPADGAWPRRGMPVLVADGQGEPRCVACGLCERACPAGCLLVVPGPHPTDPASRRPDRFDLDLGRCLLCGLCEEACPEQAIVMSAVDPASLLSDGAAPVLDRDALLVPASWLVGPLGRAEGEGAGDPASPASPGDAS